MNPIVPQGIWLPFSTQWKDFIVNLIFLDLFRLYQNNYICEHGKPRQASNQGAPRKHPSHVKWCSFCRANHFQLRPTCGVCCVPILNLPSLNKSKSLYEWLWILRLATPPFSSAWPLFVRSYGPFSLTPCNIFYHHRHTICCYSLYIFPCDRTVEKRMDSLSHTIR